MTRILIFSNLRSSAKSAVKDICCVLQHFRVIKSLSKVLLASFCGAASQVQQFKPAVSEFFPAFAHTHIMSSSENNGQKSDNYGSGYLEMSEKGFGFLRTAQNHFHPKPTDIFVTPDTIRRNFLREGSQVEGATQPPHRGTSPQLRTVERVNEMSFQDYTKAVRFENLTSIDPVEKFKLETTPELIETRVIDLVTPIGKGTRGIIVAPPRTGKTTILKQICNAITTNHPDVHAMVLLIDERPEEVTDFQRSVQAEVVASSNDMDLETHVRLSRFMIERCRRIVESGKDVFVLLDSLTRVARAYNSVHGGSGRTMTGGVDARALEIPRKMFASARKIENGGSLTILATALVDTGSRMDELIFQEFKGTGNMELILDRKLSDRRLYPALDIPKSGTRKEEKLFPAKNLEAIRKLRRTMVDLNPIEAMETLTAALKKFKTNDEFLAKMAT
jgi:transcription termination factor Rho